MRIKLFPATLLLTFLLWGCSPSSTQTAQQTITDSTEHEAFFPVTKYLLGELAQIDSLPVTPLKIITIDGKEDSIWMKKKDIRIFAQPFLHPQIDTANLRDLFAQKSFLDQTINAFTFSYDPISKLPDTLQLRRWDVYIDPQKNTVRRIYMIKEITPTTDGGKQTIQLTWVATHWCKITTITYEGNTPKVKEEKMIWDFNEPS